MCLIVVKPKGKHLPTNRQLKEWFDGHSDGFGLAYPYKDKVRIRKGAMTKRAMLWMVKETKQDLQGVGVESVDVMFHFRQATNGEVSPSNCHPFPITKNQEELAMTELDTECALVHNGIIGGYSAAYYIDVYGCYPTPTISSKTDTQEFIEDYLADLGESIHLLAVQKLIRDYSESKFALMTPAGVEYIGKFVDEDGWCYSNNGYKAVPTPTYSIQPWGLGKKKGWCVACAQQAEELYRVPNDDTLICESCFIYFEGRTPKEEERCEYIDGGEQWF